jgi:phosphoribosylamine--glycine ligase
MNILLIGAGAREHAIAKALIRSPQKISLYCCGPLVNPGIKENSIDYCLCESTDCETILEQAKSWKIDWAIIGPEAPLEQGLADLLWQENIPTIGPKKALARIESSKKFARQLMQQYQISGLPVWKEFSSLEGVETALSDLENNYVIKANGLMSGKGVKIAGEHLHSFAEAVTFCEDILRKGQTFIIEEKLEGPEFSLMCFTDGKTLIPMPLVQDHKRAYNDDKGPNTGGMGSYTDSDHCLPFLTILEVDEALTINHAVLQALTQECKERYIGILYGSFIATKKGVYVIEFNARFGDPEALNVLTILRSDFVAICKAMINGNLKTSLVDFSLQATVCKYAVPQGYPDNPAKNFDVNFSEVNNQEHLFLGALHQQRDKTIATGARTAAYVGVADNIFTAEEEAEREISKIEGLLFHREDIGTERLIRRYINAMARIRQA